MRPPSGSPSAARAHPSSASSRSSAVRTCARARCRRERTVPIGSPSADAMSPYARSAHANSSSTSRSSRRECRQRAGKKRLLPKGALRSQVEQRQRSQPPFLVSVVSTQKVVGDPEQPRPSLPARRVVALPCRERSSKCFRCEVATQFWTDAAREVAVERVELSIEQLLEGFRFHTPTFPPGPRKFTVRWQPPVPVAMPRLLQGAGAGCYAMKVFGAASAGV
jgi:hypothetical protein